MNTVWNLVWRFPRDVHERIRDILCELYGVGGWEANPPFCYRRQALDNELWLLQSMLDHNAEFEDHREAKARRMGKSVVCHTPS